jgi:hypothetical protein
VDESQLAGVPPPLPMPLSRALYQALPEVLKHLLGPRTGASPAQPASGAGQPPTIAALPTSGGAGGNTATGPSAGGLVPVTLGVSQGSALPDNQRGPGTVQDAEMGMEAFLPSHRAPALLPALQQHEGTGGLWNNRDGNPPSATEADPRGSVAAQDMVGSDDPNNLPDFSPQDIDRLLQVWEFVSRFSSLLGMPASLTPVDVLAMLLVSPALHVPPGNTLIPTSRPGAGGTQQTGAGAGNATAGTPDPMQPGGQAAGGCQGNSSGKNILAAAAAASAQLHTALTRILVSEAYESLAAVINDTSALSK